MPQTCSMFSASSATQTGTDQALYSDNWGNWAFLTGGSRDWTTNNPDALTGSSGSAIGSYTGARVTSPIFPTYQAGWSAANQLWNTPTYQNQSIVGALSTWTGNQYTSSSGYVTTAIAGTPGVTANTPVSSLSATQLSDLQSGQQQSEGWTPGTVVCGSGAPASPGTEDARQIRP